LLIQQVIPAHLQKALMNQFLSIGVARGDALAKQEVNFRRKFLLFGGDLEVGVVNFVF